MTADFMSRRALLRGAAGLGLAAVASPLLNACGGDETEKVVALGPTETPTIRLPKIALTAGIALAVAGDLLKEEGFTDVQYVTLPRPEEIFSRFANAEFDMTLYPADEAPVRIEAGDPIVALAGVNAGCFQLVSSNAVATLSDLRGKRIATSGEGFPDDLFITLVLRSVGIDMRKENAVVTIGHEPATQALAAGDIDAMISYPPFVSRFRSSATARILVDANLDRPWSQYVFSMSMVHRDYLTKNPVATKRALRALLKAADVVSKDPDRAVQASKAQGFIPDALVASTRSELPNIPYNVWRKYDPADALRFYALRLKEVGLVKGTPEQIVAKGSDFRFLQELKRELKEP